MPQPTLQFDAESHTYTLGKEKLLSVTGILKDLGMMGDTSHWTEEARDRGTLVAQLTHYYDENDLDFSTVAPELMPYLDAWRQFRNWSRCKILQAESRVYHESLMYAGTLDRLVTGFTAKDLPVLVDLKCGDFCEWHPLQTAAYALCLPFPVKRASVHLSPGKFRMKMHDDKGDYEIWKSAATVARWKQIYAQRKED